jgi:hypothetical protein
MPQDDLGSLGCFCLLVWTPGKTQGPESLRGLYRCGVHPRKPTIAGHNLERPPRFNRFPYFFLPDPKLGCHPAADPFWLGAAAIILTFSFFGFLDSRLLLAMRCSFRDCTSLKYSSLVATLSHNAWHA